MDYIWISLVSFTVSILKPAVKTGRFVCIIFIRETDREILVGHLMKEYVLKGLVGAGTSEDVYLHNSRNFTRYWYPFSSHHYSPLKISGRMGGNLRRRSDGEEIHGFSH